VTGSCKIKIDQSCSVMRPYFTYMVMSTNITACVGHINLHWMQAISVQNDPQIMVSTEICRDQTTDSSFLNSNITCICYRFS
jgi:hypothetical protein